MFGGFPYFISWALCKVSDKQLRSYDPVNREKIPITLCFSHLVCRDIGQS